MNRCRTASGIRKPPEGITDDRDERCVRAGDEAGRMAKRNGENARRRGWKHLEGKPRHLSPVDMSSIGN